MHQIREIEKVTRNVLDLLSSGQKRQIIWIALLMLVSAGLNQYTPWAMGWLTDDVLSASQIQLHTVIWILLGIFFVSVLNEALMVWRRLMVEDTATKTEQKARNLALSALLKAPLSYYRQNMTGNIHGRLNRCLEGTVKLIKLLFMDLVPSIFNSIAAIVVIFITLPLPLALVTILVVPVGIAVVARQIQTQKGIRVQLLQTKAEMDGSIVELLGGMEMIRVADSVHLEEKRFDEKSSFLRRKEMTHHFQMAKYDVFKFLNEAVFTVVLIGVSVLLALQGKISIGTVLTAYLCFNQLLKPLQELHRILDELSESMVLAEDFFTMTHLPVDFSYQVVPAHDSEAGAESVPAELITAESSDPAKEKSGGSEDQPKNLVEIEHLNMAYADGEVVIDDLNLNVPEKNFFGIAGASGCGKSSLIKAICRLEPCQGDLYIDGQPLSKMSRSEIARKVALVPQSPFLIAGTIADNICYGLAEKPDPQRLEEALEKACLKTFVESLPEGVNSWIAEGGGNLSGGQKQRIAIARIFMRQPQLLILDEATSALDNATERQIQEAVEELQKQTGMTIISIAHRLTTLKNCDQILVMSHGQIVQKGTYEQLLNQKGIFQDMFKGKSAD